MCRQLRKNHSGMETVFSGWNSSSFSIGCVRTIVVWKPVEFDFGHHNTMTGCVRTIVVWKQISRLLVSFRRDPLRENHSGMETAVSVVMTSALREVA